MNLHWKCIFIYQYDFIFILILGILSVWSNILQEEGNCANEWTFKSKYQNIEFWLEFKSKFKICHQNVFFNFKLNFLEFFWYKFYCLHPVKYWTKPIKCLEMRAKLKSVFSLLFKNLTFFPYTSILTKYDFLVILKAKYQNVPIIS